MTKITDLFNKIDPSELETMGKILPCSDEKRLSPEEEERIFQNVCQKLQLSPEKKRKHFPRKRMGIFLAAATFLLSITVGAAEYFHLNPEFLQYFHAVSKNERQTLKDMAALPSGPDNASPAVSGHGVSICADQTISDGQYLYFCLKLSLPEEAGLKSQGAVADGGYLGFDEISYSISEENGPEIKNGRCGLSIQPDPSEKDQYFAIGEIPIAEKDFNGQELSLTFTDLGYLEPSNTEWVSLISGQWTLEWVLQYKNSSVKYMVGKELRLETGTVFIQSVSVSPLSLSLTGSSDTLESVTNDDQILFSIDGILLSDGSCRDPFRYQYVGPENGKLIAGGEFKTIFSVEDIIGIRIHGTDFYFNP